MRTAAMSAPIAALRRSFTLPMRRRFGGHDSVLRFLRSGDAPRLIAFFNTHSSETVQRRYGYAVGGMTPERAAQLVGVNQDWDAALGVFEGAGDDERIVAVGRCCRLASGTEAEMAFVVSENRRRLGIATALFQVLAFLMLRRGVTRLYAQVERTNGAMLGLFRKADAEIHGIAGTADLSVRVALGPAAVKPAQAAATLRRSIRSPK